jgi:hypothetical protein
MLRSQSRTPRTSPLWTCAHRSTTSLTPPRVAEALERTRLILLSRAAEEEAVRHRMSTTLREFYDAHGDAPDELVRG